MGPDDRVSFAEVREVLWACERLLFDGIERRVREARERADERSEVAAGSRLESVAAAAGNGGGDEPEGEGAEVRARRRFGRSKGGRERVRDFVFGHGAPVTARMVKDGLGMSEASAYKHLGSLVEDRQLRRVEGGGRAPATFHPRLPLPELDAARRAEPASRRSRSARQLLER